MNISIYFENYLLFSSLQINFVFTKLQAIVLLAAYACATEIEKREAEPCCAGYGHHHPQGNGYGHPYGSHGYYPVVYGPEHRQHRRSADPEPEAEGGFGHW